MEKAALEYLFSLMLRIKTQAEFYEVCMKLYEDVVRPAPRRNYKRRRI